MPTETLEALLPGMTLRDATEVLLQTAMAKGYMEDRDGQNAVTALADRFAETSLPEEERAPLSINLGYGYLQTGAPEAAFARLDAARQEMEDKGDAAGLMNLCGLSSTTFERYGYAEQAGALYAACDASPLIRGSGEPERGYFFHNYGIFLRDHGAYGEALTRHQWALGFLSEDFGFPSAEVVDAYDAMSQTLLAEGQLGLADAVAAMALKYSEELGLQNEDTHWRIANNAAAVKRALRQPAPAFELDAAAFQWRRANLGEEHQLTYASLLNAALDKVELEEWDEAQSHLLELYRAAQEGKPIPFGEVAISYYLHYIDARRNLARGEPITLPQLEPLLRNGAPLELVVGIVSLMVEYLLSRDETDDAIATANWLRDFTVKHTPEGQPFRFETALLAAETLAHRDPEAASTAFAALDIDVFNWTRRQALSGSYDASVASRILGDDLLLAMARHAVKTPGFAPQFADAIHRWKTLEDPSDRMLDEVARTTPDPELARAARDYSLSAARFRELVRAAPVSKEIAERERALKKKLQTLNLALHAAGLPPAELPLAPLRRTAPAAFPVRDGDIVIDLIVLREWRSADRSVPAGSAELYAATHRANEPVAVHLVSRREFGDGSTHMADGGFPTDLGRWILPEIANANRVFLAPDAMLFQVDLTGLAIGGSRRLLFARDIHLLTDRSAYARHDVAPRLEAGDRAVLAGGIYYDEQRDAAPDYLAGSLREIDAIGGLLRTAGAHVMRLQGFGATEARVAEVAVDSEILHLATHGFFRKNSEEPYSLMNAGVELAVEEGAAPGSPAADGAAYALDIMDWDLSRAELVVLSACETGVGPDTPIDAVRGLPLALARAGARRSLVTLETIPDEQTAKAMERLYDHLTERNMSYSDAFIEMKRDIWAGRVEGVQPETASAFVLYGH